jgi:hypothetical protein
VGRADALKRCEPYDMLPGGRFQSWKDVPMRLQVRAPGEPPIAFHKF